MPSSRRSARWTGPGQDGASAPTVAAVLRPRGSLADLVRKPSRNPEPGPVTVPAPGDYPLSFRADQSLRHVAETLGLPACEIGSARLGDQDWSLELAPPDGSVIDLFAVEEPLRLDAEPRFVADVHLGRLARDLRLLGFDVGWRNDNDAESLVLAALAEGRIVLTRNRGLLFRRAFASPHEEGLKAGDGQPPAWGMLLRSRDPYEQLVEVARRFGLAPRMRLFSRCAACGSPLVAAQRDEVLDLVPPVVARRYSEFYLCPSCRKPYWKGDHLRTIAPLLERLRGDLGEGGQGAGDMGESGAD